MRLQYEPQGVRFVACGDEPLAIPGDALSSIIDNFLQNALQKRGRSPGLAIVAEIDVQAAHLMVAIEDDGDPVEADMLGNLFEHPVESRNGLGIGLYQSAQLARARDIQIALTINRIGCVRFEARFPAEVQQASSSAQSQT